MSNSRDVDRENEDLFEVICSANPCLIGMAAARDAIPDFSDNLLVHAGPPLDWENMPVAMRAAAAGALLAEGRAGNVDEAAALAGSDVIEYKPAHDRGAVGAMAGIISASMPVFVVEDSTTGARSFATVNEGLGQALRFGANGKDVIDRLVWIRDVFAPLFSRALEICGPIALRPIIAEALRRGDECHNRNKSGTAAFFKEIAPALVLTGAAPELVVAAMRFITGNDHFFLSLSIAHAKAVSLGVEAKGGGSLVTVMCGNGHEVGIRTSGTGDRWFTAPAEVAQVKLFANRSMDDATPTMGDSYITETIGLGGFALAAAPAIAEFVGGTVEQLAARSEQMYRIVQGAHPHFVIPQLAFRGVPAGIDVRKVVETGLAPVVNTGVASRRPGAGQIGAGVQTFPLSCFEAAAARFP